MSLRRGIREAVLAVKGDHSESELAEAWGVSKGTVGNAVNEHHTIATVALVRLGERFGPAAINPVLALAGIKAVELEAVTLTTGEIAEVPAGIASCVPALIRLLADGECCDGDVRALDREGVIDKLSEVADMLVQRRDAVRFRVVS